MAKQPPHLLLPPPRSTLAMHKILRHLPGREIVLHSADTVDPGADEQLIGVEVLNRVEHPSMPPHQLVIKKGAVLMLMRNLSDKLGMVNGTRLKVMAATLRKLKVRIITPGPHFGEVHFVPRIRFKPDAPDVSVRFTRLQFPVRLAYSMTTNKAQGQTLLRAAIHMKFHAFAHGQLFVACSRVWLASDLAVYCPEISGQGVDDDGRVFTTNVVYPEVLEAFGVGQAQPGLENDNDAQDQRVTRRDAHRRPMPIIPQRVRAASPLDEVSSSIVEMARSHADSNSNSAASGQPLPAFRDPNANAAYRRAWVQRTAQNLAAMAESSSVDDSAREYSSIEEAARADADANYTEASSASSMPAFENPIDAMRYHDAWVDRLRYGREPARSRG